MPAVVVAEVPGQTVLVVGIYALQGAENLAILHGIGHRHEDRDHGCGHLAEGAGEPVKQITAGRCFSEDLAICYLCDERGKDGLGEKGIEPGKKEFRVIVSVAETGGVGPGKEAIF